MVVQHSVKLTVTSMIEPLALTPSLGFTQKDGVNNMFFLLIYLHYCLLVTLKLMS